MRMSVGVLCIREPTGVCKDNTYGQEQMETSAEANPRGNSKEQV